MSNALGVSDAAEYIEEATARDREHLQQSSAFGIERLRDELGEVWGECQQANWDGYDALPLTQDTLRNTYTLLEAFPLGFPRPSISADPHGHFSLEWYRNPRRVLSVGITPDGLLHYAALLGPNKARGTETFYGEIPGTILELIRRVYS